MFGKPHWTLTVGKRLTLPLQLTCWFPCCFFFFWWMEHEHGHLGTNCFHNAAKANVLDLLPRRQQGHCSHCLRGHRGYHCQAPLSLGVWHTMGPCLFMGVLQPTCLSNEGLLCVLTDVNTRPFVRTSPTRFLTKRWGVGTNIIDTQGGLKEEIGGYECLCKRSMFPHKTN